MKEQFEDQIKEQFLIFKKADVRDFFQEWLDQIAPKEPDKWILEIDAMKLLGIKSKSHLWKLRTEGCISYTQPTRKHILYDRESILEYLETHKKNKF